MHRPRLTSIALAATIGLALTTATPADVSTRTRDAAMTTWIHGMTEEIALREVGTEGIPALLELLADREFPRRDNVVALLSQLAGDEATAGLQTFLEFPPAPFSIPEEDRALLLTPDALSRIAARGGEAALSTLLEMTDPAGDAGPAGRAVTAGAYSPSMRDDLVREAIRGLGRVDRPEARRRIDEWNDHDPRPAAPEDDVVELERRPVEPNSTPAPRVVDSQPTAHDHGLTWGNHVDLPASFPMTANKLDDVLADATRVSGFADFPEDVACCNSFYRSGDAQSFGTPGDGLDRIDSLGELNSVLNDSSTRVTVVRAINHCGGDFPNIIGCAELSGNKMVVVRLTDHEGKLWLHEYGHNVNLIHHPDPRYLMHGSLSAGSLAFEQSECDYYHNPSTAAQAQISSTGACHDDDGDELVSSADNCPDVANPSQNDLDGDGLGDLCDACTDRDGDGFGNPASATCPGGDLTDCNDFQALAHPGAFDACDSLDNDCDGSIDEVLCEEMEVDGDNIVSTAELAWVGRAFNTPCANPPSGEWWLPVDYNGDGCVDGEDLAALGAAWGCISPGSICN